MIVTGSLSVAEFRKVISHAVKSAEHGKHHIIITRHGQIAAILVPSDQVPASSVTAQISTKVFRDDVGGVLDDIRDNEAVLRVVRHARSSSVCLSPKKYQSIFGAEPQADLSSVLRRTTSEPRKHVPA
jgi:antitoxin (DNA-binding transcriptional repressor) of toxin-antitoxin stability system